MWNFVIPETQIDYFSLFSGTGLIKTYNNIVIIQGLIRNTTVTQSWCRKKLDLSEKGIAEDGEINSMG